jgi:hypothetical protein
MPTIKLIQNHNAMLTERSVGQCQSYKVNTLFWIDREIVDKLDVGFRDRATQPCILRKVRLSEYQRNRLFSKRKIFGRLISTPFTFKGVTATIPLINSSLSEVSPTLVGADGRDVGD